MAIITRRQALAGASALLAAGTTRLAHAAPETLPGADGINGIAAKGGRRFGSTFSWSAPGADSGSFANPAYAGLLEKDCGLLVPENELKWQYTRPSPIEFRFDRFDAMIDWAEQHGFAMRGHTLLWQKTKYFPQWLVDYDFGATPAAEAARLLTTHIRTVCQRYGRRIFAYDVVNEAIDEKTGALFDNSLTRAMGSAEAVLDLAFHTARESAPHALLVYNDYMSWEPNNDVHRAAVLRLLEGFRKRKVPVQALGVQSHLNITSSEVAPGQLAARQEGPWRAFLDQVVAMGYQLVVTEFDVNDRALPSDIAIRDRGVADYARPYVETMLGYPQLRDFLAWGMTDRYSWLQRITPRKDGLPIRGCPYDAAYRPKPLHAAISDAFATAKPLNTLKTNP